MTYKRSVPVIIFLLLLMSSSGTSFAQTPNSAPAVASISGAFTVVNGGGTSDAVEEDLAAFRSLLHVQFSRPIFRSRRHAHSGGGGAASL